jgi:hypothetical protein
LLGTDVHIGYYLYRFFHKCREVLPNVRKIFSVRGILWVVKG